MYLLLDIHYLLLVAGERWSLALIRQVKGLHPGHLTWLNAHHEACYNTLKHSQTRAHIQNHFLPKISISGFFVWAVWITLGSITWNRHALICSFFLNLNCLAVAENQSKHKAGKGVCRYGALRLICGDERDSWRHARLTWVQSVVFGIHTAAIAKGEIAEAWPSIISACKLTHIRMHAAGACKQPPFHSHVHTSTKHRARIF